MSAHPRPMSDLLLAFTGPLVWAGHFFGLYLTEALLCSTSASAATIQIRWIGAGLTVIALAALIAFAVRARHRPVVSGREEARLILATLGSASPSLAGRLAQRIARYGTRVSEEVFFTREIAA